MQWLLKKTGFLSRPAGGGDGDDGGALVPPPQQPEEAAPAAVSKDQGPPAEYPSDVPWDENPCLSCDNPCAAHKQLPDYLPIDMEESMLGSVKPYARHVLFQTSDGKTPRNWPYKLEQVENSLAMELTAGAAAAGEKLGCRVVVTAVDDDAGQQAAAAEPLLEPEEVFVLPDMVALGPVTVDNARTAIEAYLTSGTAPNGLAARRVGAWRLPSGGERGENGEDGGARGPWAACVLVCAHKLRDKRCGIAAPLIMEQLRATCAERGLADQVAVMGCSHVGGHKFAGNVIVYSAAGGHWYGRVKPCHADALVRTHIEQGRVLKELWRGRMR